MPSSDLADPMTFMEWSNHYNNDTLSVGAQHPDLKSSAARSSLDEPFLAYGLPLDPSLAWSESPIHKLPPELLGHIFSLDDLIPTTYPTHFAWTVAHVCGHWRQVALNTPRLWSTFILDLSHFRVTNQRLNSRLQFLDNCLMLSKSMPLNFVVALRSRKIDTCNAVLSRLCRHVRRWRRAFLITSTNVLMPWVHLIQGNTPILESLGFGSSDGDTGTLDLRTLFVNPYLSSLTLAGYQEEGFGGINAPWHQITSLKLIDCSLKYLPAILSQLPNLTNLEFEGDLLRSCAHDSGHLIELPNLLGLRLSGYLHHISKLLRLLHVPALTNLSMTIFKAFFIEPDQHSLDVGIVDYFVSETRQVKHPIVKYIDQPNVDTLWEYAIRYIH